MRKFITTVTTILFIGICSAYAQQVPLSSGSNLTGSGGSVSYSVGQVDYIINNGSNGTVLQGLQQPFEISIISGITEENIRIQANIYPNPASSKIYLAISDRDLSSLSYSLFNIEGKLLANTKIIDNLTNIPLESYTSGIYILQISDSKNPIKSFKIIKK